LHNDYPIKGGVLFISFKVRGNSNRGALKGVGEGVLGQGYKGLSRNEGKNPLYP